jgi:nucleoside phosphorylase
VQEKGGPGRVRVLVTFAVEAEFAPWRKIGGFEKIDPLRDRSNWYGSRDVYEAIIAGATVRVVLTGMGWWNAGRATALFYKTFLPDVCVSSGFAGSLKPEHQTEEILVATRIAEISGHREMFADKELLSTAVGAGAKQVDCFLGSKRIVSTAEEKRRLGKFGDAVEIESFRVLAAAKGRGIPAVSIRGISDSCETDLPFDFLKAADHTGKVVVTKLMSQIARNPLAFSALLKLGVASRRTANKLAHLLSDFVAEVSRKQLISKVAS